MILPSTQLIAFDLDDTFWPCMPTIIKAEEALYQWLSKHYPLITNRYSMTSMMGLRNDFVLKNPSLQTDLSLMRKEFLSHLAVQCHYPAQEVAEEGFKEFFKWRNTVTYYLDVIPALKMLSQTYVIATISNGNADVMQTEAAKYIDYSINAAEFKKTKPHRKMFDVISERSGINAAQCLYCGDDIAIDVVGSRNAGWQAVWVNRENKRWLSEFGEQPKTITSLAEL